MNSVNTLHSRFTNFLKGKLEAHCPKIPEYPLSREENGVAIFERVYFAVPTEIGCRIALLAERCVRTVISVIILLASLPSPLLNRLLPSDYKLPEVYASWEKFSAHVRFLTAETFELVGVIVCNAFLILTDLAGIISPHHGFHLSKPVTSAQIQIEKIAKTISGEQRLIHHYQKRLAALKYARFAIHLTHPFTEEEKNAYREKVSSYDLAFLRARKRRISRRPLDSKQIEQCFNEMLKTIEEKLPIAIPTLRARLEQLGVQDSESFIGKTPWEEVLYLHNQIEVRIECLHQIHDPDEKIRDAVDDLKNRFSKNFIICFKEYQHNHQGSIVEFDKLFGDHFFIPNRHLEEVFQLFIYEQGLPEDVNADFRTPILEQIEACKTKLRSATQRWHEANYQRYDQLSTDLARSILDVDREADSRQIKLAYHRLARIHHPDKGGNASHFNLIKNAYEVLNL